jgi:hypothetical protein
MSREQWGHGYHTAKRDFEAKNVEKLQWNLHSTECELIYICQKLSCTLVDCLDDAYADDKLNQAMAIAAAIRKIIGQYYETCHRNRIEIQQETGLNSHAPSTN